MVEQKVEVHAALTDWTGPVVFAPKKDGILRFCEDNRQLYAVMVRDAYQILRVEE